MAEYELVREIQNSCANNQLRDVSFDEIETDDPVAYARGLTGGAPDELTVERAGDGSLTVYVQKDGLRQRLLFTPI